MEREPDACAREYHVKSLALHQHPRVHNEDIVSCVKIYVDNSDALIMVLVHLKKPTDTVGV